MAQIPYTADSIIDHNPGLKRNNDALQRVLKSPNLGEAFARLNAAHLTGLALSPRLRELLILNTAFRQHCSDRELVEIVLVRGFYDTIAMPASVFALEIDRPYSYDRPN
jgi:hypothetical protein